MVADTLLLPLARWKELDFRHNAWAERVIHGGDEQFRAAVCTRQCGKTTDAAAWIDKQLMYPHDGKPAYVGVASYDYEHAELCIHKWWSMLRNTGRRDEEWVWRKRDHVVERRDGGATLEYFSESNGPATAEGRTFSAFFIDESQRVSEEMWTKTFPAFDVRDARVLACGTADVQGDQTWFYSQFALGQDPEETNHISRRVTAWENPWTSAEKIIRARRSMTADNFRMLYLAEFVNLRGQVFPDAARCFTVPKFIDPQPGRRYVMGVDVAKVYDYTVAYVMDRDSRQIVQRLRFNGMDYTRLEEQVSDLYRRYKCSACAIDTNGVGENSADHLRKLGLNIVPYKVSHRSKPDLIHNLQREIEFKRVALPEEDTQLLYELTAYRPVLSRDGAYVKYEAPVGYHDDCVIALALVLWTLTGGIGQASDYATW